METVAIEVLGPDASEMGAYDVCSYTVHADGRLTLAMPDASIREFEPEEWIHVRDSPDARVPQSRRLEDHLLGIVLRAGEDVVRDPGPDSITHLANMIDLYYRTTGRQAPD